MTWSFWFHQPHTRTHNTDPFIINWKLKSHFHVLYHHRRKLSNLWTKCYKTTNKKLKQKELKLIDDDVSFVCYRSVDTLNVKKQISRSWMYYKHILIITHIPKPKSTMKILCPLHSTFSWIPSKHALSKI